MDFVIRPLEERDLPACVELLRGHLAYPASILSELPKVWRRLLREDVLVAAVAESRSLDGKAASALAFGLTVFVTEAWMAAAQAGAVPIRQEVAGPSPILRPAGIRRANRESGLNVLNLQIAHAPRPEDSRLRLLHTIRLAFIEHMRGYRVSVILQELIASRSTKRRGTQDGIKAEEVSGHLAHPFLLAASLRAIHNAASSPFIIRLLSGRLPVFALEQ